MIVIEIICVCIIVFILGAIFGALLFGCSTGVGALAILLI